MTDIAGHGPFLRTVDFTWEEASARIRRRYRAEARFKFYGLGALGVAALALVLLLSDIASKAWPAFIEHRVVLTATATLEQVSTDGKLDRASLIGGDYAAPMRAALQELFPDVTRSRCPPQTLRRCLVERRVGRPAQAHHRRSIPYRQAGHLAVSRRRHHRSLPQRLDRRPRRARSGQCNGQRHEWRDRDQVFGR